MSLTVDPEFQALIPPLSEEERFQLETNVCAEGCRDPLVTWDGLLLDGHHRYAICTTYGLPYQTVALDFPDRAAAKVWIIRNQFGRRNLSAYTRVELSLQLEQLLAAQAKERQGARTDLYPDLVQNSAQGRTRDALAEIAGVSHDTVDKARFIMQHAPPEVKDQLKTGELSIHAGYQQTRQAVARERSPDPVLIPPALPSSRYRCLVIDPPWPMQKIEREERPDQGVALDYPVMSLDEIAALPIADLADPAGCHVYLWTTQKFLPAALDLFTAWGVRYQCLLTWVKPTGITPYSWMYNTEHVLFGRIGSLNLDRLGLKLSFDAPVTRHSEKPPIFYERVLAASPGPRLELFARQARPGFTVWGNEVQEAADADVANG